MKKILIAEDDPSEREGLSALLRSSGFAVKVAADGVEALQRIQQEKFDLLLTDIWMPRMSGLDLLSRLPNDYRPRVVVMTADDKAETLCDALHEKAYQYITKPFDPKQLLELIRSALQSPSCTDQIQVLSAQPNWVELRFPCDLHIAERIQDVLRQLDSDLPSEVQESVGMAFHELLMNAIEWGGHLNPTSKVQIAYLRTERLLMCRIADPGDGFKPVELEHAAIGHAPDEPYAHTYVREEKGIRPGGFGILLAKSLVDELVYNEAHNEVVMVKYLN
jgi:CheY-like chemotaxis protein/anti-sigma regulatory factor (Ser/Thr protein kinase)